jgi:hypothetical protein
MRMEGRKAMGSSDLLALSPLARLGGSPDLPTQQQFGQQSKRSRLPPHDLPVTHRPKRCWRNSVSARFRATTGRETTLAMKPEAGY